MTDVDDNLPVLAPGRRVHVPALEWVKELPREAQLEALKVYRLLIEAAASSHADEARVALTDAETRRIEAQTKRIEAKARSRGVFLDFILDFIPSFIALTVIAETVTLVLYLTKVTDPRWWMYTIAPVLGLMVTIAASTSLTRKRLAQLSRLDRHGS